MTDRIEPLSRRRLTAFATLGVATGGFNIPLQAYLPAFYAQSVGVSLQTVGFIFLTARLLAAVSDPVIGWASDNSRTRFGRRKPWIVGGGIVFVLGAIGTFLPPPNAGAPWLAVNLLLLCLGWTATATPLYAWGGELSDAPRERARIQAYIQTAASIGIFAILLLPGLLDLVGSKDISARIASMGGLVAGTALLGLTLIGLKFHEDGPAQAEQAPGWRDSLRALGRDAMLWRIIASDFFVALGQGCRGAVFVFFVTHYMGLQIASLLLLLQYAFGIVASHLWASISYRLGRARTLVLAELVQVGINLSLLFITPERLWLLVLLVVAQGLTQGSGNLMLRAMIYDVADRHRDSGQGERAGLFSSVFNVTTNAAMALSIALAFSVIAQFGFNPAGGNDLFALQGLLGFLAIAPAVGHFVSVLFVLKLARREART
ncbi:MFS transporter [Sphingobium sp. WCS2017Hpa-17]|uniref:MFS transporter n=1 Tax=Sphingobium sp. WCS2017Hpa-17 TaxID=3073638 RepID=UPI00288B8557|nr:MFS transporter [Sphingobium sp. WCS2017Hpa-17]